MVSGKNRTLHRPADPDGSLKMSHNVNYNIKCYKRQIVSIDMSHSYLYNSFLVSLHCVFQRYVCLKVTDSCRDSPSFAKMSNWRTTIKIISNYQK